jgi:hypothetical protein
MQEVAVDENSMEVTVMTLTADAVLAGSVYATASG